MQAERDYQPEEEVEVTGTYTVIRDGTDTGDRINLRKGQKFPNKGTENDTFRLVEQAAANN